MPHLTVEVSEARLAGNEEALIAGVTNAVVEVYGEWARELVSVRLTGIPSGRWGQGGRPVDTGVVVVAGVRSSVFDRPDAHAIVERLGSGITSSVVEVLGGEVRDAVMVELVASPPERTFVGGRLAPERGTHRSGS